MAVGKTGYTDVNIMNPDVATQLICRIRVYWREDYYTSGGYSTITITDIQGFVMHRVGFTNVKLSVKADNTTIYDCTSSVLWHFYSNEDSTLRPVYEYTNWNYDESCRFKAVTSSPIYHNSDGSKTINLTVNVANVSVSTYSASNQSATSSIVCTPTHTHSYTSVVTAPTCTEQGYTTHTCSCGDSYIDTYIAALGHSYTSSVTKEPTCVEDGVRTYTCSKCGDSYTETIAATGEHNYVDTITPPTCTSKGYTTHTCNVCGDSYIDTYIGRLNHEFVGNTCINCGSSSFVPFKRICYIYNGTEWVRHIAYVSNNHTQCYIYENISPDTAMFGLATLGAMKLGERGR